MDSDDRHRPVEVARLRTELTVQDLWLRYLALGGTEDAFGVDGYLQGLLPLDTFQQDVLAQAVNEGLQELYLSALVPLSHPASATRGAGPLRDVVAKLLGADPAVPERGSRPPGTGTS